MKRVARFLALLSVAGCAKGPTKGPVIETTVENETVAAESLAEPKNFVFPSTPFDPSRSPTVTLLSPSWPAGASAVWGSIGRDHRGHIYAGASTESSNGASAHLLEYDPTANDWQDRGGAVEQLKRLTLARAGESQNKIHTKILQAADGFLYFASMDEAGELDDGTALPVYGSHLWRVKPGQSEWEHLKAVPEGIVAAAVGGSNVYYLGYFGHVVYKYDTKTGAVTNTRVGATGGHVSRNFLALSNGKLFVPRVRSGEASLVELNGELDEMATHPLRDYDVAPNADSHGIVSFAPVKNGSHYFCTDKGRLHSAKPMEVHEFGLLHPAGPAYVSCLMSPDGEHWLCGIGHRPTRGEPSYEWIVHDLRTGKSTVKPLSLPVPDGAKGILVYGSATRDDEGRWYVGGAFRSGQGSRDFTPAVWRIQFN